MRQHPCFRLCTTKQKLQSVKIVHRLTFSYFESWSGVVGMFKFNYIPQMWSFYFLNAERCLVPVLNGAVCFGSRNALASFTSYIFISSWIVMRFLAQPVCCSPLGLGSALTSRWRHAQGWRREVGGWVVEGKRDRGSYTNVGHYSDNTQRWHFCGKLIVWRMCCNSPATSCLDFVPTCL